MGMMAMVARAFYTERFEASEQGASLPRDEALKSYQHFGSAF